MVARRPQRQDTGPRYQWPAHTMTPPPRNPAPALDLSWRGTLALLPGQAVSGELRDAHGWVLDLRGNVLSGQSLALRLFVARVGVLLVQADDLGITADLTEQSAGSWPLLMALGDDGWTGRVAGRAWALAVRGTAERAGVLGLLGAVEAMGNETEARMSEQSSTKEQS